MKASNLEINRLSTAAILFTRRAGLTHSCTTVLLEFSLATFDVHFKVVSCNCLITRIRFEFIIILVLV